MSSVRGNLGHESCWRFEGDLAVRAWVAGRELGEPTQEARVSLGGSLIEGTLLSSLKTENFDRFLGFNGFTAERLILALPELLDYLRSIDLDEMGLGQLSFISQSLDSLLDLAGQFETQVIDRIDFDRPVQTLGTGTGAVTAGSSVLKIATTGYAGGRFSPSLVGQLLVADGVADPLRIAKVAQDGLSLSVEGRFPTASTGLAFSIQTPTERISTIQEFVDALNRSGVLGKDQAGNDLKASFDLTSGDLRVPIVFNADLVDVDTPIDLGFDLGDSLSLSTQARGQFDLGLSAGVDFILNLSPDGIQLAIDRLRLEGDLDLEVADLEVTAALGFLRLTAGGAGTGSGVGLHAGLSPVSYTHPTLPTNSEG